MWWAQTVFAIVLAATAVVASVLLAYTALPLAEFGESITNDLWMALGFFLLFLAFSMYFAVASVRARRRHALRQRALRGDDLAMPVAAISVYPERAPDVSTAPLVLEWHATKRTRFLYIAYAGAVLLIVCAEVVLMEIGRAHV